MKAHLGQNTTGTVAGNVLKVDSVSMLKLQ
jgi:hypothetical protein